MLINDHLVLESQILLFFTQFKNIADNFRIILNNQFLKCENEIKYLGVVIDCHLNWKDHVSYISKKFIGAISKVRHFVELDILKSL